MPNLLGYIINKWGSVIAHINRRLKMYYEESMDNLLFRPDPKPNNKKLDIKRFPPVKNLRSRNNEKLQARLEEQELIIQINKKNKKRKNRNETRKNNSRRSNKSFSKK